MRDLHRMKDKLEVSLDGRQVGALIAFGVVLLAAVFGVGIAVGKKAARDERPAAGQPDLLSAIDAQSAAAESAQRDASLNFQEELTRRAPPRAPEPAPAKPVEVVKAAEPVKAPEPVKPAEPVKAPEVAKIELAQALEHAAVAPAPVKPEPARPEPAPVARLEPAHTEVARSEPTPTRVNDAGALKDALAKAQKVPDAAADGQWTLQLSAFQDKAEAEHFASGLRDKGYAPFIVEAMVSGKGTWYRVRMGRFPSRDAAGRYLTDFKRETSLEAIVTSR